MSARTFYVVLFRRWNTKANRWTTAAGVDDELPRSRPDIIACFEVAAPTKSEAIPVVMEWLVRDRPAAMTVRQVGTR